MEKLRSINKKEVAADLLYDVVGCLIYAVGINLFTAPNHIAPGGLSGLATVIHSFVPIPIGTQVFFMNLPILLASVKVLGAGFTLNTFKTVFISTIMLNYVTAGMPKFYGDPLLAALFGGVCIGTGLGIVFSRGSTTGGTDVLMRMLKLRFPGLSMGNIMLMIDLTVILTSVLAFRNLEVGLYGIIAIYCSSTTIDKVTTMGDRGKTVYVFSEKNREIAGESMQKMNRGVTYLKGEGAYTGREQRIVLCAVRASEFFELKKLVYAVDPAAFVIVNNSEKVFGAGFGSAQDSI